MWTAISSGLELIRCGNLGVGMNIVNNQINALLGLVALTAVASPAMAEPMPSQSEMWKIIQAQQQQIKELSDKLDKTEKKADAVTEVVETKSAAGEPKSGAGSWAERTQLGGYGELHYNGGDKDKIDFHRFVLLVKHQFSDSVRMFSELELEHALTGGDEPGEVELEQAYLEFDLTKEHRAKAGLFLLPVGIINEHHEPPTFFGVERNPVESNIIPSTWWEGGVGISGEMPANLRYDLAFHSGLKTEIEGDNAFKIRGGRQKVADAEAKDGAVTARLSWLATSGVEIGAAGQYQNDITQRSQAEGVSAVMLETHADIRKGPFGLRALYAHWNLGGDAPELLGRDVQDGWYVEPAYYLSSSVGEFGFFARYNSFDNESGDSKSSDIEQVDTGINYWPVENVVLKADIAFVNQPEGKKDDNILNLGVGFAY